MHSVLMGVVMKKLLEDRRLFLAVFGIICLMILGYFKAADVAASIATICLAVAGANATEKVFIAKSAVKTQKQPVEQEPEEK